MRTSIALVVAAILVQVLSEYALVRMVTPDSFWARDAWGLPSATMLKTLCALVPAFLVGVFVRWPVLMGGFVGLAAGVATELIKGDLHILLRHEAVYAHAVVACLRATLYGVVSGAAGGYLAAWLSSNYAFKPTAGDAPRSAEPPGPAAA